MNACPYCGTDLVSEPRNVGGSPGIAVWCHLCGSVHGSGATFGSAVKDACDGKPNIAARMLGAGWTLTREHKGLAWGYGSGPFRVLVSSADDPGSIPNTNEIAIVVYTQTQSGEWSPMHELAYGTVDSVLGTLKE